MSNGKMRIKMGSIEVEYEGSEEFIKQELPDLLTAVSKLYQSAPSDLPNKSTQLFAGNSTPGSAMSVTTIAAKLGVKSGPELLVAAAARLTRGGAIALTRQALLDEMKLATGFYKASYRSNMSNQLLSLVKEGKLQETATDTYTLSIGTKSELETKLAN